MMNWATGGAKTGLSSQRSRCANKSRQLILLLMSKQVKLQICFKEKESDARMSTAHDTTKSVEQVGTFSLFKLPV